MPDEYKIRQIQKMALERREMGHEKYGDAYWDRDMYKEAIEEHLDSLNYNTFQLEKLKAENDVRLGTIIRGHEDIIQVNILTIIKLMELQEEYNRKHGQQ